MWNCRQDKCLVHAEAKSRLWRHSLTRRNPLNKKLEEVQQTIRDLLGEVDEAIAKTTGEASSSKNAEKEPTFQEMWDEEIQRKKDESGNDSRRAQ